MSGFYYDPDDDTWSASHWLSVYTNELYNDYLNYWEIQNPPKDSELDEKDREWFRRLEALTTPLVPMLSSLSISEGLISKANELFGALGAPGPITEENAPVLIQILNQQRIVRDGIRIALAERAADVLLAGAEDRFGRLLGLITRRRLSHRASAYLQRSTQLYLWGFEPEAVVQAAGALEAAYEERFPDLVMFQLQIKKSGKEYQSFEYEQAAIASRVYTSEEKQQARRVRVARNDILHNIPETDLMAIQALEFVAGLLDKLFPLESPKSGE